ncbi:GGDEF domain-containing protein [Klebsiella pneumoniae subsp. pneumoniae]|nr:GGDEF domain-containing protein [Klebsiella pneumoniae subsp. pneumoniae]
MILDIDFSKKINDSWGHLVGDEVLFSLGKQLAKLTSEQVQPARIGGGRVRHYRRWPVGARAARSGAVDPANARTILINHQTPLSISIGVGTWRPGEAQETFIRKVDEALYKAKHNGRGRVEWAPSAGAAG